MAAHTGAARASLRGAVAAAVLTMALTMALVGGCGPIGYVSQVTRTAATAVDEARAVNAVRYAPYWWTRAVEYLRQARVEAAAADFEAANRFGRLATAAAEQARADSIRRAADPKAMDEITAPRPITPSGPARGEGGMAPVSGDDDDAPPPPKGKLAPATGDSP